MSTKSKFRNKLVVEPELCCASSLTIPELTRLRQKYQNHTELWTWRFSLQILIAASLSKWNIWKSIWDSNSARKMTTVVNCFWHYENSSKILTRLSNPSKQTAIYHPNHRTLNQIANFVESNQIPILLVTNEILRTFNRIPICLEPRYESYCDSDLPVIGHYTGWAKQEALLMQRNRASTLSVEIV